MPKRGDHAEHFIFSVNKVNGSNYEVWCKYCINVKKSELKEIDEERYQSDPTWVRKVDQELETEAKEVVQSRRSKVDDLTGHLSKCENAPANTRLLYSRRQESLLKPQSTQMTLEVKPMFKWDKKETEAFELDICRLVIGTNSSWSIVQRPIFQDFIRKHCGNAPLPSRQTLVRKCLPKLVKDVEEKATKWMNGKLGTGQCDGWKNVARASIIASIVTIENRPNILGIHTVTSARKTAGALLSIVLKEMCELHERGVILVGWCSDAGGDSRAMRLRLAELMPQLVVLDCWAHQINLIVGDYLKLDNIYVKTMELAMEVIKWFNNHSFALGLFQQEQRIRNNNKVLSLIQANLTRWTTHYQSVNRLSTLKVSMRSCVLNQEEDLLTAAGPKPEQKATAQEILNITKNAEFWDNLDIVCRHLRPLATAANATQGTRGTLDSIALTLAGLYCIYALDTTMPRGVKRGLLDSIEKRWMKTDQDAFLMAVVLNPYIRLTLFKKTLPYSTPMGVYGLATRLWKRFFPRLYDSQLSTTIRNYCFKQGEFSHEAMFLDDQVATAQAEGSPVDILQLWQMMDNDSWEGSNQLVKLAIRIFSVIGNAAECERLFSKMGDIHTKKRNRFNEQTVRDMVVVKMALEEDYKLKAQQRPPKRSHDGTEKLQSHASQSTTNGTMELATNTVETILMETSELIADLTNTAANDDNADVDPTLEEETPDDELLEKLGSRRESSPPSHQRRPGIRLYFGSQCAYSIPELYDFDGKESVWKDLWELGLAGMKKEECDLEKLTGGGNDSED